MAEKKAGKDRELSFGDYVNIRQKLYGVPDELFIHKVIGTKRSNAYVPVQCPAKEVIHKEVVPVVSCICCGVVETEVLKYRIVDVEKITENVT